MELKFETLNYQLDAVNAVLRLFEGQPNRKQDFELQSGLAGRFVANELALDWESIGRNLNTIQAEKGLSETDIGEHGLNFSVEMETGTGKTYVYLRTIFELNRQYGWTKFVIVVPSVAIREGVLQTLRSTRAHFADLFDKPVMNYAEYSSSRLSALRSFAVNDNIEILVINIQSFEKDLNVINQINESGDAPITQISQTRPIVIIDEPQNMETEGRLKAIESLNPLFTLRYSATHKASRHKIYSLNPVQAYNLKLVKQIEVLSVTAQNDVNGAPVELLEVLSASKGRLKAKVNILVEDGRQTKKKIVSVKNGDDLFDKSGGNEAYRHGFIIEGMDSETQEIALSDGRTIERGSGGVMRDEIIKMQIHHTVAEHLKKEKRLKAYGIKVLSLFFIDKVENYRTAAGEAGKFALWFEEIYTKLSGGENPEGVHNGYFSQDKQGRLKNTNGTTQADNDTYHLIMRDKETLLSFDSPLRFIFSHSALKEGWDNPNVFQICTLNESNSPIKKRQEIGRGLRLAVNQSGVRVRDEKVNVLTVIPNESYEHFAATLQQEYQDECSITFASDNIKNAERKKTVHYRKNFTLDPAFQAVWQKLSRKPRYRVNFDTAALIESAAETVRRMPEIQKPKIQMHKARIRQSQTDGIWAEEAASRSLTVEGEWAIPDVLGAIQKKTGLTRRTVYEILVQSDRLPDLPGNPQRFIDLAADKINAALRNLMVKGIRYDISEDERYCQSLMEKWRDMETNGTEFYENDYTFKVSRPEKTINENYIPLDSAIEKNFARDCENYNDDTFGKIPFYFKLPKWFKIPTPLGNYNPDWAVVAETGKQAFFVTETKGTAKGIQAGADKDQLRYSERLKIECAEKYFKGIDELEYRDVEKVDELTED
ncbi:DEAD/DEAH box helicase family protein [Neisseria dumasiana]|uniref:DEAD/DEAH box helicase n=1 Tax=Neisseria dumasiana TaxID=1931275 RepID=A0A1X3DHK4_9NEIS|nr:DEAD/DEAH box helicase family protein [Neisseria dumasiana]OSI20864.1 DEAD/DEAH box helicase [Neisseria dumasiana]